VSSYGFRQQFAQIEHIALATSDVERLSDFYRRLGAVASPPGVDSDTALPHCTLDFCSVRLEVFERRSCDAPAAGDERAAVLLHLGFALESADALDELSRSIAAAGHPVLELPHRTGAGRYESVVLDPDGNRIKLMV
jgi:lactoylglutathione lyase